MKKGPWVLVAVMAAVVVALLVALLLQGGGDDDPRRLLAAAPDAVDAAGTAHLAMTIELGEGDAATRVEGAGAVDFASGAGWFVVDVLEQRIELRTDGATLFVQAPGTNQWLATRADGASAALGGLGTGASEAIALVDLLRDEPGDVEDLGEEEIDGASTRHLGLEIDAVGSLASLAPPSGELALEVWIDDRDLPVRQLVRGEAQGVPVVLTMDLVDWGDDLGARIPPEGDVREVGRDELLQIFSGTVPA